MWFTRSFVTISLVLLHKKNMMPMYAVFHGYLHLHIDESVVATPLFSINNVRTGAKFGAWLELKSANIFVHTG